jgi:hypothetical protein
VSDLNTFYAYKENMKVHLTHPIHEHEFICECGHKAEYIVHKTSITPYLYHMKQVVGKKKGSELYGKAYFMDTVKCNEKGCECKSPVWKLEDGRIVKWSKEMNCAVIVENGKEKRIF